VASRRATNGSDTELQRRLLRRLRSGQHVNGGTLGQRQLGRQMGRCTEAVQTEPTTLGRLAPSQGAIPDDAGTRQRRRFKVVVPKSQRVCELRRHGDALCIAAVGIPAGVGRLRTQVLHPADAPAALSACALQPGPPPPGGPASIPVRGPSPSPRPHPTTSCPGTTGDLCGARSSRVPVGRSGRRHRPERGRPDIPGSGRPSRSARAEWSPGGPQTAAS
jgi:hypothetical protein